MLAGGAFQFSFSSFSFLNLDQLLSGFPGYPPSHFPLHTPARVDHYVSLLCHVTQVHGVLNIHRFKSFKQNGWIILLKELDNVSLKDCRHTFQLILNLKGVTGNV